MLRRSKKTIAILTILTFLMTLLPLGTAMAASTGYTALQIPTVDDKAGQELGSVRVEFPAGQLKDGSIGIFRLPEDFELGYAVNSAWEVVYGGAAAASKNYIEVPRLVSGDANGLDTSKLEVKALDDNEFQVKVTGSVDAGMDTAFIIHFGSVKVDEGFDGDINLVVDAPGNSGFATGTVVIGRVTGGDVAVEVTDVPTFSDKGTVTLRLKEDRAGAFEDDSETVKFVLPNGFEWGTVTVDKTIWGDTALETNLKAAGGITVKQDELRLNLPKGFATTKATSIELKAEITVEDETDAKSGDVIAQVRGESDLSPQELVVGKYGQYEVSIEVKDAPEVFAGKVEQLIGKIVIAESVKESLVPGRTITMTLPSNAKWGAMDTDSDKGISTKFEGFPGKDGKTAKWSISGSGMGSSDAATLELDDLEVVLEPGASGDLVVEVGGTAGLSGELVVAKIVAPVTIAAAAKSDVKIGLGAQAAGDLTITEAKAEAIGEGKLKIDLPDGVKFAVEPKVEVTEGDLDIDADGVKREGNDNQLIIPVDRESTKASTIKITGIQLTVDRTVPEGDLFAKVQGDSVVEVNNNDDLVDYFNNIDVNGVVTLEGKEAFKLNTGWSIWPETQTAALTYNASVVTPAPSDGKASASFVLGDTKYTVNGVEQTMDVAAYAKNGRTYLPVRYVGLALGVNADNILWDGKTATLIKGDRVVQVTKGDTALLINGATITMDAAPEIVNGRTMLPLRWIAQAMGASVDYDETTKTVSIN